MTTDRDALAALITDALVESGDWAVCVATETSLCLDGYVDLTKVADAILAAGWRAPLTPCDRQCAPRVPEMRDVTSTVLT